MKNKLLIFLLLSSFYNVFAQGVLFVNNNNNNNIVNGKTWNTAYLNLTEALANAKKTDTIWVAKGTYYTTSGDSRDSSFILKNGVLLFGGFDGNETNMNQRDWKNNKTILSGDIGILNDSTDNAYNILRCANCDSTNIIDGFYFQNGNANNSEPFVGAYSNKKSGGAIYIDGYTNGSNSLPEIRNCTFSNNASSQYGGAIFWSTEKIKTSKLYMKNCIFKNNYSNFGGAIYTSHNNQDTSQFIIDSCSFYNNTALYGGGLYIYSDANSKMYNFINSKFKQNKSTVDGGAIELKTAGLINEEFLNIIKCIFDANSSHSGSSISLLAAGNAIINLKTTFDGSEFINHVGGDITTFGFVQDSVLVKDCTLKNNQVSRTFGGASISKTVINSKFVNNIDSLGIMFQSEKGYLKVYNSIFSNVQNIFTTSGKYDKAVNIEIYNSLFNNTKNILNSDGVGKISFPLQDPNIKTYTFGIGKFNNCIFQNDKNAETELFKGQCEVNLLNCGVDVDSLRYYLIKDNKGAKISINGQNNIRSDLFVDSLFHLLSCSSAINAGNNAYASNLKTDIDGNPRIFYNTIDIGPYEYQDFKVKDYQTTPTYCSSEQGTFVPKMEGNCSNTPTVMWQNEKNETGNGADKLSAGTYTFYVKDSNGCMDTIKNIKIEDKGVISADFNISNLNNATIKNGSINVASVNNGKAPFKYLWSTGEMTQQIKNLAAGKYSITITDANGCTYTTTLEVTAPTATADILKEKIFLYPNPASEKLYISEHDEVLTLKIYDLQGKLILSKDVENETFIDISILPKGIYFVELSNRKGFVKKEKLIVE